MNKEISAVRLDFIYFIHSLLEVFVILIIKYRKLGANKKKLRNYTTRNPNTEIINAFEAKLSMNN